MNTMKMSNERIRKREHYAGTICDKSRLPTSFSSSLRCKVSRKRLQRLSHLLLHEEAYEVGGGVELQGQRAGEASSPLIHCRLQSFTQSH